MDKGFLIICAGFLVMLALIGFVSGTGSNKVTSNKPITPRLVIEQAGGVSDTTFIYEKP